MSDAVCAGCGEAFDYNRPCAYVENSVGLVFSYHCGCGDPLGQKAKDAEIASLKAQRDKLAEAATMAIKCIDTNLYHQREKVEDAAAILRQAVGDLRKARDAANSEERKQKMTERDRDEIACRALMGMLAHATRYRPRPGAPENWHDAISEEAYQIADAMLKARQKTTPL